MKGIGGKGVLALSLVLGVATSYMVYNYVDQAGQAAKPIEKVPVVTAAKDIPARTTITSDMLRVSEVPVDLKLPTAIVAPTDVTGKISKLPISQGEEVLSNKVFGDREESGLAFVVPQGKRALAVSVNEVVGSGGMIVPGDFVDVVCVLDTDQQQTAMGDPKSAAFGVDLSTHAQIKSISQYLLQNVEVLAIAQTLEGDAPQQSTSQKAAQSVNPSDKSQPAKQAATTQPNARTATLAVGPEDAEKLVLGETKGQLRLVLRAHGDDSTIKTDDGLFANLNGAAVLKSGPKPL
jgi:pilus assembly protein CpaB